MLIKSGKLCIKSSIYPLTLVFMGFILFPIGTIAEGAPVIRISAHLKYNIDVVCEYITEKIPVPLRDFSSEPRLIGMFNFVLIAPLSDLCYSKTCLKRPLKKKTKIGFQDPISLNAGKGIAECPKRAFCNTFDLH